MRPISDSAGGAADGSTRHSWYDRVAAPTVGAHVLILGAGLTGLAAAAELGASAIVLERDERPGGLVRTERVGEYWFDRTIHLLHFRDDASEVRVRRLLGATLAPCRPEALVECAAGTTRFPIQNHLYGLSPLARFACLRDLAAEGKRCGPPPRDYREFLERSFGRTLCDLFFFPYNRKMWRRPLETLVPRGFQWNIARPSLADAAHGAFDTSRRSPGYNANGWYPRPGPEAPLRGAEVLSDRLAGFATDLRLGHELVELDLDRRLATARTSRGVARFSFRDACLSTIPLPRLLQRCPQVPADLRRDSERLLWNRVVSVAISVRGQRPTGTGHWRYFTDESLCFTRLVFLHEFDPRMAPEDGWPLLAEIPERAERPLTDPTALLSRVVEEVERTGILPRSSCVLDARCWSADPAYVVFTAEAESIVDRARAFFADRGVTLLGRYGRWEYSSMAQALRDGFAFGAALAPGRTSAYARAAR